MKVAVFSALLAFAVMPVSAQHTVTPPSTPRLPMTTVFKGDAKFRAMVQLAEKENWRQLPLVSQERYRRGDQLYIEADSCDRARVNVIQELG